MIATPILNRLADRLASVLAPPRGRLLSFVVDGEVVGVLDPVRASRLHAFPDVFHVGVDSVTLVPAVRDFSTRTAALDAVARALAQEGWLSAWRDERYAVASTRESPPCFQLERAAARYFGILTYAVHVNGTTTLGDGTPAMWLGRRSARKAIDPGQLDNMVGGGIGAGATERTTLAKEAWEEAGLSAAALVDVAAGGCVHIRREQPDGVQRETLFVYDLALPVDVMPVNQDGEVVAFRLVSAPEAATIAGNTAGTDVMTADAALVVADWLMRHAHVPAHSDAARRIEALRRGSA